MTQVINKKILKASEHQDVLNTRETLLQAKFTAQKILAEAEKTRKSAYQIGYLQGIKQAQLDNVEQTVNIVSQSIEYLGTIEKDIASIVFTSVKKIIASYEPDELTVQAIKSSVKGLSNGKQILLRASPELAKILFNQISDIGTTNNPVNLVADERLENNHCTIESDLGIIHVNVNDMVEKLESIITSRLGGEPIKVNRSI